MNLSQHLDHPVFKAVSEIAEEKDVDAYVVGGFVRDLILERPVKDVDFVVVGPGIDMARAVADRLGVKNVNVFKNFGTAMFMHDDLEVEFVGARKESYQRDSRKPIVEDGTIQDDQNRRDFTINAMALSMRQANFGELVDPFGGIDDLKKELIRTPLDPDITYSDDPLRMMRAVRFAAQLEFEIQQQSFDAIRKNVNRIEIVSRERITDELNKIILSRKPSIGFKLLFQSGLLEIIFPEMVRLHGVEVRKGVSHKDNFYHTLQVLDNVAAKSDNLWLRWAAILHDIAKPATKRFHPKQGWTFHGHEDKGARMVPKIFKRMKLPLDRKMKFVQKLVLLHLRPIALTQEEVTDSAIRRLIFDAGDDLEALLTLCQCDITTKNDRKKKKYQERLANVEEKIDEVEERDRIRNWQPPISGEEIMEAFDIKPCKAVGDIKNAIKEAILDGEIPNEYDAAREFMLKKGEELGLR